MHTVKRLKCQRAECAENDGPIRRERHEGVSTLARGRPRQGLEPRPTELPVRLRCYGLGDCQTKRERATQEGREEGRRATEQDHSPHDCCPLSITARAMTAAAWHGGC